MKYNRLILCIITLILAPITYAGGSISDELILGENIDSVFVSETRIAYQRKMEKGIYYVDLDSLNGQSKINKIESPFATYNHTLIAIENDFVFAGTSYDKGEENTNYVYRIASDGDLVKKWKADAYYSFAIEGDSILGINLREAFYLDKVGVTQAKFSIPAFAYFIDANNPNIVCKNPPISKTTDFYGYCYIRDNQEYKLLFKDYWKKLQMGIRFIGNEPILCGNKIAWISSLKRNSNTIKSFDLSSNKITEIMNTNDISAITCEANKLHLFSPENITGQNDDIIFHWIKNQKEPIKKAWIVNSNGVRYALFWQLDNTLKLVALDTIINSNQVQNGSLNYKSVQADFDKMWKKFYIAVANDEYETIVSLSKMPLEIRGPLDFSPVFNLNREKLIKVLPKIFATDVGIFKEEKSNQFHIIENLKIILDKEDFETFRIGSFSFAYENNQWQLVRAYYDTYELENELTEDN